MNYSDPANWHPVANIFPLIGGEDLDELVSDIRSQGLLNPIVLHEQKVLDGRNRLIACLKAGVAPRFIQWDGKESPISWVVSQNINRRHLTPMQKAIASNEAKPLLEADAKARQQKAGKVKSKMIEAQPQVQKQVAKQFGVSEGYVYAATKLQKDQPEVYAAAKAGKLSSFAEVKQVVAIQAKAPELAAKVLAGTVTVEKAAATAGVKQTVKSVLSSESNEWYTPAKYIDAARATMGTIDLDPASSAKANKVVKADEFFTIDDDGLTQPWSGKVWCNPPYGSFAPKFVAKLIDEYENGDVSEAILLVGPRTDTAWFQSLFAYTLCFTDHRLKFWNREGDENDSPTSGSVFVYFGKNHRKFHKVFGQFGAVVVQYGGHKL